jgi:hypothetical protein
MSTGSFVKMDYRRQGSDYQGISPKNESGASRVVYGPACSDVNVVKKGNTMKRSLLPILAALTLVGFTACDARKAEINTETRNEKEALDNSKKNVDNATDAAKKQADADAKVEKANLDAQQKSAKAQIDADKKKADANADAAKKEVDATQKNP